jgi:uncharacterized protein
MIRIRVVLLAMALMLWAAGVAALTPADVENPRATWHSWIADRAGLLDAGAEAALNARIDQLERTCGAQIAIVTVENTGEDTPKQFATALLHRWGVGNRDRDDGVLVLVVPGARRIEIETGYGAEGALPDGRVGRIIREQALPRFKVNDYAGGLIAVVNELCVALENGGTAPTALAAEPNESLTELPVTPQGTSPIPEAQWISLLVSLTLFALGGLVVQQHLSHRRSCPKCGLRMRWIQPREERPYLSADEALEEELRSLDHRVWWCERCSVTHVEHAIRHDSAYADCPKCTRRTVSISQRVVVEPTYTSEGSRELSYRCVRPGCTYTAVTMEVLAMLVAASHDSDSDDSGWGGSSDSGGSDSSGSDSDFGGGDSGGGGAGGSW